MTNNFQSRIVEHGFINPKDIVLNPYNTKLHPDLQHSAIKGLLKNIGWIQEVIINKRTGNLVDGHDRVKNAIEEGESTVPVAYIDVSDVEEKQLLLMFDAVTSYAVDNSVNIAQIAKVAEQFVDDSLRYIINDMFDRNKVNIAGAIDNALKKPSIGMVEPSGEHSDNDIQVNVDALGNSLIADEESTCFECKLLKMCSIRSTMISMCEKQKIVIAILQCGRFESQYD